MSDFEKIMNGYISRNKTVATTISLTQDQAKYIDNLCEKNSLSRTKVIQAIIDEHIGRDKNE